MNKIILVSRKKLGTGFDALRASRPSSFLIPILIAFAILLIIRRAWVCDDAYITFRTIDNFYHGYRFTWNVTQRVQVYTHPLWMLLLTSVAWIFNDIYLTSLLVALLLTGITLFLLTRKLTTNEFSGAFILLVLVLSKAFIDFSTSGLENPLSHLLAALFFWRFFKFDKDLKSFFWLSFIASLAILNRMDAALLYAPALVYAFWQVRSQKALWYLVLGQLPFIFWELFATFYYGFPFPNTAYAKLNTGLISADLIQQGFLYLLNAIQYDPVTPLIISTSILLGLFSFNKKNALLALGTMLYVLYVIKIGGDFMEGRFLTLPLVCAVILLSQLDFSRISLSSWFIASGLLILMAVNIPNPTIRLNDLGPIDSGPIHLGENGILNERLLYYGGTGLLNARRNEKLPNFYWGIDGERAKNEKAPLIERLGIGLFGYYAGPEVYILDRLALADPLLSHLPMQQDVDWRIGHYERMIPPGYKETLQLEQNVIEDPNLALFYDKMNIITRGSLASPQRLLEIWKMNTGQYDHLIDAYHYKYPNLKRVNLAEVSPPLPSATACTAAGPIIMDDSGIEIVLPIDSRSEWIHISLDHNDKYRIFYYDGEKELAMQTIPTAWLPEPGGISLRTIQVPRTAARRGFDRIHILPLTTEDQSFCLGDITLVSP
jgi:arabinofuranosyltransferase